MDVSRQVTCRRVLITMLGRYASTEGSSRVIPAGALLATLRDVGFGESAARSALGRACGAGLLVRHRAGRLTSYAPTPASSHRFEQGRRRIYGSRAVITDWDGTWTLLAFTLPERSRSVRGRLRTRLAWAGFGTLQSGLWVAPGRVEIGDLLTDLGIDRDVWSFVGSPRAPDPAEVLRRTWRLDAVGAMFDAFVARWDGHQPATGRVLATHLTLITEWRLLLRQSPAVPHTLVPADWPGTRAQETFTSLDRGWSHQSREEFERIMAAHALR